MTAQRMGAYVYMLPLSIIAVEQFFINVNLDSLYFMYSLIEDAIKSDPKLGLIIKKASFPVMNYRYWQLDGTELLLKKICQSFFLSFLTFFLISRAKLRIATTFQSIV